MKTNYFALTLSILSFLIICSLAFIFESIIFIYIASACPIIIVSLLPNSRAAQWIRSGKDTDKVDLYIIEGKESAETDLLIITFQNNYIDWDKNVLYFSLGKVPRVTKDHLDQNAATLTVLRHDLVMHPKKRGWVGIALSQLAQRVEYLSYTTEEVNRLAIRVTDVTAITNKRRTSRNAVHAPSVRA
jgi:hypothetical protein